MSRYDKADDFTLVNDFTIHHGDKPSSGRAFMSTRVPQSIWLELDDVEFTHRVEWQDSYYENQPRTPGAPNFKVRSVFTARGTTEDTITVFRVPDGRVARFSEVHVMVKPLASGQVGGEKRTSTMEVATNSPSERGRPRWPRRFHRECQERSMLAPSGELGEEVVDPEH